ncbi:Ig-like domain-containing protein [Lapillicoccus jejuensis]|uniref:Ig-like domain-containing protein n=1 Tax=Lapillicoccus jejuensis TaxID=402171 RepID=UPI0011517EF2|nr:fibronectin type III domain-containing protein [Lapillicoccus jejuensis]
MASLVVLALVAGVLTWVALRAEGELVRKTDLHDGGVWVTNGQRALLGRLNKPAQQLDAGVAVDQTGGSGLDVLQDGASVVALSAATNQATPVDTASATLATDGVLTLPKPAATTGLAYAAQPPVDLRGGSVAVVDPATGKLWAARTAASGTPTRVALDALQAQSTPVATVGAGASVAVGADGTVYAVSGTTGRLVTLPVGDDGTFAAPVTRSLGVTSKALEVTAVGGRWVVLDAATGLLRAAGLDRPVEAADVSDGGLAQAALQQPGPAATSVLLAGPDGLSAVPLDDGGASGTLVQVPDTARRGTGPASALKPTAPVRLGSCAHAAWAGPTSTWYGRACGSVLDGGDVAPGAKPPQALELGGLGAATRRDGVRLRTNRGLVVLNDLDSGNLWDLDNTPLKIDDWDAVVPPPQQQDKNAKKDPNQRDDQVVRTPPKAEPDQLRVRAGRTSTLHVLDNDSDATGSILAIAPGDVSQPSVAGVTAAVSSDGQAVDVTVPDDPASSEFSFTYRVTNGTGGATSASSARVTVTVVDDAVNGAPYVRQGQAQLAKARYAAVPGGHVAVGVVADWRDPENDPLTVEASTPGVGVDPSGALAVTAPTSPGALTVRYAVADGHGGSTAGSVPVTVLADDARPVPPLPQPDVVRAVAGKPVQIRPLGNDVPGADPTDPDARMRLAAQVRAPGQLLLDTDLDTGVLTVTGRTPGTVFLTYAAQVGSAVAPGRIRVDVLPDPGADPSPVAAPDAATVRGQSPVVTDVLANDSSPRGDVLVVQKVLSDASWLRASVVQGRFLRIEATSSLSDQPTRRGLLRYTVSDGTKTAVGVVAVVQQPPADAPVPDVEDDEAVVRTGDVVTVPVLDNDTVSGGVPLVLDPRSVKVVQGGGQAFASGSVLRYIPDATPPGADQVVTLEYGAHPEGSVATERTGRVTVTVKPLPTAATPDQPPTARSFSASVTAGDTITITVPTSGVDPDGDLAYVVGVVGGDGKAVDLSLGRVLSVGPATIRYQAYPRSAGTEVIRYAVRDRFGLASDAFVRVGVVQPGDPQPPVAVADDVVAAPGRTVTVDPTANDLVAPGDTVEYDDFAPRNEPATLKDFARQKDDTFRVKAPDEADPRTLTYGITDGLFDPSVSTVTVRGQKGFNNPPVALDDVAQPKPGETAVVADVLANDRDPDGDAASLKVVRATGAGVSVVGQRVRIALQDHPRVVPYVIEDADGAQAMALVYVPTSSDGAPFVIPGRTIRMDANATATVDLSQYLADPRGRALQVTSPDTVSTSPSQVLASEVTGPRTVRLTSSRDYTGPGALMLEVTDATGPDDKAAVTAYVSVPVQVGPLTPVLRCPSYEVSLIGGGVPRTVDVPRLCHAWLPDGLDPASVTYTATWDQRPEGVELRQQDGESRGSRVRLAAAADAPSGTGTVTVGVQGSGESASFRVRVTSTKPVATAPGRPAAPPPAALPRVRPITVDGLQPGQSRAVDVRAYLDSPLATPQCSVSGVQVVSGTGVTGSASGCSLTVTASSSARRTAVLSLRVADGPGREVPTQATVTIKAPPDAPAGVTAVADRVAGGQARVSWRPPAYDGGLPVLEYEVRASTGKVLACTASPCTVTGLANGTPVTFTVRARNGVDWSPASAPSGPVTPDTKPQAVTVGRITPGDRTLKVTWSAPKNEGSPVDRYQVQWVDVNGGSGSGTAQVAGSALAHTVTGLVNDDQYKVRVQAHNGAGWGPYGPAVTAQSVGTPATVAAPRVDARPATPSTSTAALTITWSPVDPDGPAMQSYTVWRDGARLRTVSAKASLQVSDSVPYDGRTHRYAVSATNGGGKSSKPGPASSFRAAGVPATPGTPGVTTGSPTYSGRASWRLGDPHSGGYRTLQWETTAGHGGTISCSPTCSSATFGGLGTAPQQLRVRAQNDTPEWSPWSAYSASFQPYGPTRTVANLQASVSGSGGSYTVTWTWSTVENGRSVKVTATGCTLRSQTSCSRTGVGYQTTASATITQTAVNAPGTRPASTSKSARTPDKPLPAVSVRPSSATCGDSIGVGCPQPGVCRTVCNFVDVKIDNSSGTATCTVNTDSGGGFSPHPVAADGGWHRTSSYYGGHGGWVTATCDGRTSPRYSPWP